MVEQFSLLAGRLSQFARGAGRFGRRPEPVSSAREPCAGCGEETAVGSIFFSDRLTIPRQGRSPDFVCTLCESRIRAAHAPQQMSREDVAMFVRNASAADIAWASRF